MYSNQFRSGQQRIVSLLVVVILLTTTIVRRLDDDGGCIVLPDTTRIATTTCFVFGFPRHSFHHLPRVRQQQQQKVSTLNTWKYDWDPPQQRRRHEQSYRHYYGATTDSSSSSSSNHENDNDTFMASLKSRVQQVNDRATRLPLVVLDSMLPRQVLNITITSNALLIQLMRTRIVDETPYFGMLGMTRSLAGHLVPLKSGVLVDIIGKPTVMRDQDGTTYVQVILKGSSKRFRLLDPVEVTASGWMEGRVEYFNSIDDETESVSRGSKDRFGLARAMAKARSVPDLVQEWIALAREKERRFGQIDALLTDLGTMPTPEQPTDLSLWVGALINPLPAMGVALEIRPALLYAETAEERIMIALDGITKSIRHMRGEPLL
jgi:ATP-dependent protease La (LON) substrate-binding domain